DNRQFSIDNLTVSLRMTDSPPPSYSPPRPPPPYESQNSENLHREHTIKVSPVPFTPLATPEFHHTSVAVPTTSAQPMDPSLLTTQPDRPTVIIYQTVSPSIASTSAPYQANCPKCQQEVTTRQSFVTGTFTWLVALIVLFFFFPLACLPFCIDSCKDVHHYCPKCSTLISVKKRFI
ncbi:hypothetical protein PMAYCL1PPCAC_02551, partial [Pristionchus mayeri]